MKRQNFQCGRPYSAPVRCWDSTPLQVANEGKLVAIVPPEDAEVVLEAMKANQFGMDATLIGEVSAENPGRVVMKTRLGSSRIVDMLTGDLLPRIC